MVLLMMPVLALCSVGMIVTVKKFVDHHLVHHSAHHDVSSEGKTSPRQTAVMTYITSTSASSPQSYAPDSNMMANLIINGEEITFVKDSSHVYADYDLAIDFCTRNAEELGFHVREIKLCIYRLIHTLQREFQDMEEISWSVDQNQTHASNQVHASTAASSHNHAVKAVYLTIRPVEYFDYKALSQSSNTPRISDDVPRDQDNPLEQQLQDSNKSYTMDVAANDDNPSLLDQPHNTSQNHLSPIPENSTTAEDNYKVDSLKIDQALHEPIHEHYDVIEGPVDTNSQQGQQLLSDDKVRSMAIEINGVSYIFEYALPQYVAPVISADKLAMDFCQQYGFQLFNTVIRQLKLSSKREIVTLIREQCYLPLRDILLQRIEHADEGNIEVM